MKDDEDSDQDEEIDRIIKEVTQESRIIIITFKKTLEFIQNWKQSDDIGNWIYSSYFILNFEQFCSIIFLDEFLNSEMPFESKHSL